MSRSPRWALGAAVGLAAGGLLLATAGPASAHNVLVESTPQDGETLDSAPDQVELVFNEEVLEGGNGIVVTGPNGSTYEDGEVQTDTERAWIGLSPLDQAGDYTINYRIISADGHPLEDSLGFTLADEAVPSDEATDAQDPNGTTDDGSPEETDSEDPVADLAMPPWVAVVIAIAVVGIVVSILIRFMRSRGNSDA
ncbi:copper resistance CopC family protein [Spiractinospora alimapuensis]|uniref:copper resistance CopC family protein n=1 Tax=Spiractinospora alimapuensis TaxID=2820884 RepID=UPI001F34FA1C|nr:copper resistance CopC family protein [Spiractinospora alimapuensis]